MDGLGYKDDIYDEKKRFHILLWHQFADGMTAWGRHAKQVKPEEETVVFVTDVSVFSHWCKKQHTGSQKKHKPCKDICHWKRLHAVKNSVKTRTNSEMPFALWVTVVDNVFFLFSANTKFSASSTFQPGKLGLPLHQSAELNSYNPIKNKTAETKYINKKSYSFWIIISLVHVVIKYDFFSHDNLFTLFSLMRQPWYPHSE